MWARFTDEGVQTEGSVNDPSGITVFKGISSIFNHIILRFRKFSRRLMKLLLWNWNYIVYFEEKKKICRIVAQCWNSISKTLDADHAVIVRHLQKLHYIPAINVPMSHVCFLIYKTRLLKYTFGIKHWWALWWFQSYSQKCQKV